MNKPELKEEQSLALSQPQGYGPLVALSCWVSIRSRISWLLAPRPVLQRTLDALVNPRPHCRPGSFEVRGEDRGEEARRAVVPERPTPHEKGGDNEQSEQVNSTYERGGQIGRES